MIDKDLYLLVHLVKKNGIHGKLETSTGVLAEELGLSQQTISRKLQQFTDQQLIVREVNPTGVTVKLSSKGKERLSTLYGELQSLFQQQSCLKGIVKDGLGEGKFYMSQEQYRKQFESLLGFAPFLGTLNIAVDKEAAGAFLASKKQLYVSGFTTKERTFGGLKCYSVQISKKVAGAIIVPDRTMHTLETIEVIAATNLRQLLKLENGKEVVLA